MDSLTLEMLTLDLSEQEPQSTTSSQSPLRKRPKIAHNEEVHGMQDLSQATLEEFDICPVYARNHATWNQILSENEDVWLVKCSMWYNDLRTAFKECYVGS